MTNSYNYDAWGRPRDSGTWALLPISITDALTNLNAMQPRFDRGYTGHEIMAGFGLINMNGRLYDPYLQRFLSPDNYVQSPLNAQNYNRYTYCLNNPLMYTDPSGYSFRNNRIGYYKMYPAGGDVYTILSDFSQIPSGTVFYFSEGEVDFVTTSTMSNESFQSFSNYVEKNFDSNIPILKDIAFSCKIDELTILGVGGGVTQSEGGHSVITSVNGIPMEWYQNANGKVTPDYTLLKTAIGLISGYYGISAYIIFTNTQTVYRVFGGDSNPLGRSWTPVNPNSVNNYRDAAGLPDVNTGRFVIEGTVNKNDIMLQRNALPFPSNNNNGGLLEYLIDPFNVNINRVSGVNPPF